jgi:hypothetical protein
LIIWSDFLSLEVKGHPSDVVFENRIKQIQFEKQLECNTHNWKSMFNQANV